MFRTSKTQGPYSFDIAAKRILKGWKAAGQPIITNTPNENKLTYAPKNNVCTPLIDKTSQTIDILQFTPVLGSTSTDKLLQHAHKLSKIAF